MLRITTIYLLHPPILKPLGVSVVDALLRVSKEAGAPVHSAQCTIQQVNFNQTSKFIFIAISTISNFQITFHISEIEECGCQASLRKKLCMGVKWVAAHCSEVSDELSMAYTSLTVTGLIFESFDSCHWLYSCLYSK